jgi:hypothetical protein
MAPAYLTALRQAIQKLERNEKTEIDEIRPPLISFNSFISSPSDGLADGLNRSESDGCLQCCGSIGPGSREITVRSTATGQLALVHEDCFDAWQRRGPSR